MRVAPPLLSITTIILVLVGVDSFSIQTPELFATPGTISFSRPSAVPLVRNPKRWSLSFKPDESVDLYGNNDEDEDKDQDDESPEDTHEDSDSERLQYMATFLANRLGRAFIRNKLQSMRESETETNTMAATKDIITEESPTDAESPEDFQKTMTNVQEAESKVGTAWNAAVSATKKESDVAVLDPAKNEDDDDSNDIDSSVDSVRDATIEGTTTVTDTNVEDSIPDDSAVTDLTEADKNDEQDASATPIDLQADINRSKFPSNKGKSSEEEVAGVTEGNDPTLENKTPTHAGPLQDANKEEDNSDAADEDKAPIILGPASASTEGMATDVRTDADSTGNAITQAEDTTPIILGPSTESPDSAQSDAKENSADLEKVADEAKDKVPIILGPSTKTPESTSSDVKDVQEEINASKVPVNVPTTADEGNEAAIPENQDLTIKNDSDEKSEDEAGEMTLEKPSLAHEREGDRNLKLQDEFVEKDVSAKTDEKNIESTIEDDGWTGIPPVPTEISMEFGRPLQVVQEGLPPIRN